MSVTITAIPAFSDNYFWLLHDAQHAVIVDPGDAQPVLEMLEKKQLTLTAILITHHHWDHTNGIEKLIENYPDIPVYGPAKENIPCKTHALGDSDIVHISKPTLKLSVMDVPGHTAGHIAYLQGHNLFCGDTLFASGCGRVFDGTLEDLHNSLQKIAALPSTTIIYCAHEYTIDNLGFAQWVEPDNEDINARIEACHQLLDNNQATVPTQLSVEKLCNPFIRTHLPHVIAQAEGQVKHSLENASEVFAALRTWKDTHYD
ncbi:MAG: Hydroxyacylglutathione hydrolase (EC [uncultured Thiotrichaceae bacterium]|uniref:Hydroxyacylglutathione hydrolase n=1 Tax=uncultured Thiotrichaceae bacterium TaxID=298394 RepID=A0A6S6UIJ1_9GAMM|nr:MAG: Hydroxyacylglutathione hydrolase (EC [uncultured Thiotrichaceae bacterium]